MKEGEKFSQITSVIITMNPDVETARSLIRVLQEHIIFKDEFTRIIAEGYMAGKEDDDVCP